jgi:hypothetical protein
MSQERINFESAAKSGQWDEAFKWCNALSMWEMLDSIKSLPDAVRGKIPGESWNFLMRSDGRKYNINRIRFAYSVATELELISVPLSTDVDLKQVQDARDWLQSIKKNARDAVRALIVKWKAYRSVIAEPERYGKLAEDLYIVRNAGFNGNPSPPNYPSELVDPDDATMASVEHYFLCRSWVGSGYMPAWELRKVADIYDYGKQLGITPRHNPNKPVTPPSTMQKEFQEEGIRDGESDLLTSAKDTPSYTSPPKYY